MSNGFKNKGHDVFTVDIDEKFNVDWYKDVSKITTQDIIERFGIPDVLWAGTPCESYSVAAISRHRKKNPQNGSLDPISDHAKFCDEMNKRIYNPAFKCCTLTCVSGGYHNKKVMDNGRPRKLTEIEYERLQGLPDNYTNVMLNGKPLSSTVRYSLCGNGWNEPTIEHVLKGILDAV